MLFLDMFKKLKWTANKHGKMIMVFKKSNIIHEKIPFKIVMT